MKTQLWAKRAIIGSLAVWVVLVTTYFVLGMVGHEVLPVPYNAMIMLILAAITSIASAAWFAGRLEVRLGRIEGALIAAADRRDFEDRRLNAHLLRIGKRLDDLEAPTVQLYRAPLVAVGMATVPKEDRYTRGYLDAMDYLDAMAARPDAKVIPFTVAERGDAATHHP